MTHYNKLAEDYKGHTIMLSADGVEGGPFRGRFVVFKPEARPGAGGEVQIARRELEALYDTGAAASAAARTAAMSFVDGLG